MSKPQHVSPSGLRGVNNGDGTVSYTSFTVIAPEATRKLMARLQSDGWETVIHPERRVGKKVKKCTTWVDRGGVRRYAEKDVVCGTRHVFLGGKSRPATWFMI
jgi:hypothetical protein